MKKELTLFDSKKNQKRTRMVLYTACVLLFATDFFVQKHGHLQWESWFGFFAIYGFVCCVLLVLAAKYILRPLMKRKEDYYD